MRIQLLLAEIKSRYINTRARAWWREDFFLTLAVIFKSLKKVLKRARISYFIFYTWRLTLYFSTRLSFGLKLIYFQLFMMKLTHTSLLLFRFWVFKKPVKPSTGLELSRDVKKSMEYIKGLVANFRSFQFWNRKTLNDRHRYWQRKLDFCRPRHGDMLF